MPDALHTCLAENCEAQVARHQAFCAGHWRLLPALLQQRIVTAHQRHDRTGWAVAIRDAQVQLRHALVSEQKANDRVLIKGTTFPVRDRLKAMGATWDGAAQGWWIDRQYKLVAEVLVGNAGQVEQIPGMEDEDR